MVSYMLYGVYLAVEVSPFMSYLSFMLLFFTTLIVVDSLERLRWVLLMAIGSVAYASLHVVREWQKYGQMSLSYRPGWVTGDPNYFSVSALLCVFLAVYLLRSTQRTWERWFCIVSIALTLVAFTLAASRGGFLGLTAGVLLMVWRSKRRTRNFLFMVALILPIMIVMPASPLRRLLAPNQFDEYSANERLLLAQAGLEMLRQYPWTGVGAGNFKVFVRRFGPVNEQHIAHNTYVSVGAEEGLPGLVLFVSTAVATLVSLERVRRSTKDSGSGLIHQAACGMQVGLIAYFLAVFFVTAETHRLYWLIVFLSIVLPQLTEVATGRARVAALKANRMHPARPGWAAP
jgi:O-antigen ligase